MLNCISVNFLPTEISFRLLNPFETGFWWNFRVWGQLNCSQKGIIYIYWNFPIRCDVFLSIQCVENNFPHSLSLKWRDFPPLSLPWRRGIPHFPLPIYTAINERLSKTPENSSLPRCSAYQPISADQVFATTGFYNGAVWYCELLSLSSIRVWAKTDAEDLNYDIDMRPTPWIQCFTAAVGTFTISSIGSSQIHFFYWPGSQSKVSLR